MEISIRTKQSHVLKFIGKQILQHPLVYPIFGELLNVDYSDIEDAAEAMLLYICGQIIRKNTDEIYSNNPTKAIPINSTRLRTLFGNRYSKYIAYFITKGILQKSNTYLPGKASYEYNINPAYQGPIVFRNMQHKLIERKIRAYNKLQFDNHKQLYNDCYNAIYWFTTGKLAINKDAAINCIEKFKDRGNLRMVAGDITDDNLIKLITVKFPAQFNTSKRHIDSIGNKDYDVFIHYRGWRLYSTLTQMSSLIRNYISYDGSELCAIDIKNSQAFHLCHLFNSDFWASQSYANSFITLYTKEELEDHNVLYNYIHNNKGLLKEIRAIARSQAHDIREFKLLATSGTLYETISDRLREQFPAHHRDRETSKKRWVQFLNFDIEKQSSPAYSDYRRFKQIFPNVCQMIELLKSRYYTDIAFLLQRLEAKMLVHNFTSAFGKVYPNTPIFTVHDTFITYATHKDQAINLLNSCYEQCINAFPHTDGGKNLNHENAMATLDNYMDVKFKDLGLARNNINAEQYQELFEQYVS